MKVKIFTADSDVSLEREINSFLKKNVNAQIEDIQYNHSVDDVGEWHNALILYKEDESK